MILCAGEALVDMLPRTTSTGEDCFAPHAGGAVMNTAVAVARLGHPAALFTGISNDLFGDMLRAHLADSGVDSSFAAVSDRPTTLAFVRFTDGQASYAFYDENSAGRMLGSADLPALPEDVTACFFGGISLAVEPCAAAYEEFMLREASRRVTMIDPNVRPGFIADENAYRARMDRMVRAADIVKVSDYDIAWLDGSDDIEAAARRILDLGPKAVFVTIGADGAFAVSRGADARVPARPVEVVDTVGAGDTFNAGVLAEFGGAGLLDKERLAHIGEDALRGALELGVSAAAVTVSRAGANPPRRDELSP